uniref:Uncharacterized LOC109980733 n=1 Tax=Labrus bergylta TaxID=56723 RepID=A0A3Q3H0W8_9LABR
MNICWLLLCGVALLLALPVCVTSSVPTGRFQTRCLERHFSLSVKSSFLGLKTRFDFEDQYGLHSLTDQEATLCGYSVIISDVGDLVFRASFLACHVQSKTDTDYHLRLWFVNVQADGEEEVYPLQLHCLLQGQWSPREIVCEENYMEVSVQRPVLPVTSKNQKKGSDGADLAVMFHTADHPPHEARVLSPTKAAALGYHISLSSSHLILRCHYSSPLSYLIKETGADLEIVRATLMFRLESNFLSVDVTVACPLNDAAADGPDLLWAVPLILSPLVHGQFKDKGVRIGMNGQSLTESEFKERGFKMGLQEGRVEVRIPLGDSGGHIRSGVLRGQYSQAMLVDLFFMSQWEDERWTLTQYRCFRLLKTPLIPQIPIFTDNTVPSEGFFSVTLGVFAADVSLQKVTVDGSGDLLIWTYSNQTLSDKDLSVSKLSHPNGSHSYRVLFPVSHPKVIPEHIGGGFKTYSIFFTFSLTISPSGEVLHHHTSIEPSVEYKVCLPDGRIVAVVDTTHTIPPAQPNRTTLLDPGCVPMETDSARALFSFSMDSCGTTMNAEGNFLVYENQISYSQDFLPSKDPLIHRDSPYRLTIQCHYPINENHTVAFHHPLNSSLHLLPTPVKRIRREAATTVSVWNTWMLISMVFLLMLCSWITAYLICKSNKI